MVRLASQTAAHKLVQIVGVLLIPIAVLLALHVYMAKIEINSITQERAGIALTQSVISAPAILTENDTQKFKLLEQAAGVNAGSDLEYSSINSTATRDDAVARIGLASGLRSDSEQVIQALAEVVFEHAPSYAQKLNALAVATSNGMITEAQKSPQISIFLMAARDAQAIFGRIESGLLLASRQQSKDAKEILQTFQEASKALEDVVAQFSNPNIDALSLQNRSVTLRQKADQLSTTGVKALQTKLLLAMDQRLSARVSSHWQNLGILMLAGVTSAAAGIGLAILMMRSTFIRLDEIEIARRDAIAARTEAESIALRFTAINADISRLNRDMASKVTALKEAQEELVKKGRMEQLGQLIATIAHEVRNPLGAIRTTAFMVERKIAGKGLGLEGHLQRINNSVNRCDTIIAQLLDFSRTKEINTSPMLFDDWVAKTVREEASSLPENILIECALGLEGETVHIDPARMQRALVNLLKNASEALLGQQDRISTGSQLHHHIWVSTKRLGDHAVIRVADNGPGIAAEYIQKIREPLFTTKSFGTGLGIPAVEQVVNQHGGRLDISSDIGKGAVFSIHLPLFRQGMHAA